MQKISSADPPNSPPIANFWLRACCHILEKSFPKNILCIGVQPYFEISLLTFIHKFFWKKFLSKCDSLFSADMDLQKCEWKRAYFFHIEAKTLKNGQKRTKNGYCVNSPLCSPRHVTSIAFTLRHKKSCFFYLKCFCECDTIFHFANGVAFWRSSGYKYTYFFFYKNQ